MSVHNSYGNVKAKSNFGRRNNMITQRNNPDVLSNTSTNRSDFGGNNGQQSGRDHIERRSGQHSQQVNTNVYAYPTQIQPIQYIYPTVTQNLAQAAALSSADNYAYQCTLAANYNTMRTINYPNIMPMVSLPQHNSSMYVRAPAQPQYIQMAYTPQYVYSQTSIFEQRNYNLLKQIEFYFSPMNLKKDSFIRCKMNSEGYIPLILVTGFPRVQAITNDLFLISQVLQHSTEVELSPDGLQVRPKKDWKQWPLSSNLPDFIKCAENCD